MGHPVPTFVTALAAAISFGVTLLGLQAWRRSGNPMLGFVTVGFFLFFVKSALVAYDLRTDFIGHENIEWTAAMFDIAIIGAFVVPFFLRK